MKKPHRAFVHQRRLPARFFFFPSTPVSIVKAATAWRGEITCRLWRHITMFEKEERRDPLPVPVRAILGFVLSALFAYGVAWHM
jgi:hypothetical protein